MRIALIVEMRIASIVEMRIAHRTILFVVLYFQFVHFSISDVADGVPETQRRELETNFHGQSKPTAAAAATFAAQSTPSFRLQLFVELVLFLLGRSLLAVNLVVV